MENLNDYSGYVSAAYTVAIASMTILAAYVAIKYFLIKSQQKDVKNKKSS